MTNQIETKQIKWEDLEVAEEQIEKDSLVIDWIPDLIEDIIVDWYRPRVERWYIMPGLGPLAEQMQQEIQQEIEKRSFNLGTAVTEEYISGFEPGIIDLGAFTEEEIEHFRADWSRQYAVLAEAALAFCTPSRPNLTGRE